MNVMFVVGENFGDLETKLFQNLTNLKNAQIFI